MEKITSQQIKSQVRLESVENLRKALISIYGEDNVFQVGNLEFSAYVRKAPTGEKVFANYKVEVKDYQARKTDKRVYKAYNGEEEGKKYQEEKEKKRIENMEKDRLKAEKRKRDEILREKQKEIREKDRKERQARQTKKVGN